MIPYLVALSAIYAILLGFGWTREDIIKDFMFKIWSKTSGNYYKNRQYAEDLGVVGSSSSFWIWGQVGILIKFFQRRDLMRFVVVWRL